MAAKDNKKRGEIPEPTRWSNEITGIIWITAGLLLLLSLVKYSPADLPKWGPLEAMAGKSGAAGENLIGPVGGILGFVQILLFGAAGYLLPVGFIWFGVIKLAFDARIWPRAVLGFSILLLAGAAWLDAADFFFKEWAHTCNLSGPGGVIGGGLGGFVLTNVIGKAGTLILTSGVYLIALIMLTGQQPIRFAKACYRLARLKFHEWQASRSATGKIAAREAEMLAERERQREQRRQDRESAKSATSAKAAAEDPQAMLPLREIPTPEIIDASQRRAIDPELIGKNPFSRKPSPEHQGLQEGRFPNYQIPQFDLLDPLPEVDESDADDDHKEETRQIIIDTLKAFGIEVTPGPITRGPTITRYEIYPSTGLRVSRISQLEADIARATCAERINILAPIPGKDTVGIEIANSKKQKVTLRELLESDDFQNATARIPIALGKDVYGKTIIADLAAMPHGLVAGTTGSGKSVCINSIIASILYRFTPEDLRFIMIDPKVVEMQIYNTLPHLIVPVVTDPKKVLLALRWAIDEMEKRYAIFAKTGVRNIATFNERPLPKTQAELDALAAAKEAELPLDAAPFVEDPPAEPVDPETLTSQERIEKMTTVKNIRDHDLIIPDRMPFIVIIVDELADLMQTAPADVESAIARITQKARAAGIHMIIATQTPRADVITGVIKANVPCRIAFQVASGLDSRVILDENGAERLLGQGDMMYRPPGTSRMIRAQGVYVTDEEIRKVVEHASAQSEPAFETSIQKRLESDGEGGEAEEVSDEDEDLVDKCIEVMRQEKKASTSLFQRRLRLGYTRAARILDILEQRGYVGPGEGAKPRDILVDLDAIE